MCSSHVRVVVRSLIFSILVLFYQGCGGASTDPETGTSVSSATVSSSSTSTSSSVSSATVSNSSTSTTSGLSSATVSSSSISTISSLSSATISISSTSTSFNLSSASSINEVKYRAFVDFPPDDANLGGHDNSIHVRGHLVADDVPVASPPEGITIKVNGIQAVFIDNNEFWSAEIPLNSGSNIIETQVIQNESVVDGHTFNLRNTPISKIGSEITSDGQIFYSIDLEEKIVMATNENQSEILLSLSDPIPFAQDCLTFGSLSLSPDGSSLLVDCEKETQKDLLRIQLSDTSTSVLSTGIGYARDMQYVWISNEYILYPARDNGFLLLNSKTGGIQHFDIYFDADNYYASNAEPYLVANNRLYIIYPDNTGDSSSSVWWSIDINDVIDGNLTEVRAHSEELALAHVEQAIGYQSKAFFKTGDAAEIAVFDFDSNNYETIQLESDFQNWSFNYINNDRLIIRGNETYDIHRIDTNNNALTNLPNHTLPSQRLTALELHISPDETSLLGYDRKTDSLTTLELDRYSVVNEQSLQIQDTDCTYRRISMDWNNNILYHNCILSWLGTGHSDSTVLYAYNLATNQNAGLLTVAEISSFLMGTYDRYRIDDLSITPTPEKNIIWFSAKATQGNYTSLEGVYSFNTETRQVLRLYETIHDQTGEDALHPFALNAPFLSNYSSAFNGVVLTLWEGGYLKVLNSSGQVEELIPTYSPYIVTGEVQIDERRRFIYYGAYVGTPGSYIDSEALKINVQDYSNNIENESRLVASNSYGVGPDLKDWYLALSTKRQVLYSNAAERLMILDIYSGDRVLKDLKPHIE